MINIPCVPRMAGHQRYYSHINKARISAQIVIPVGQTRMQTQANVNVITVGVSHGPNAAIVKTHQKHKRNTIRVLQKVLESAHQIILNLNLTLGVSRHELGMDIGLFPQRTVELEPYRLPKMYDSWKEYLSAESTEQATSDIPWVIVAGRRKL